MRGEEESGGEEERGRGGEEREAGGERGLIFWSSSEGHRLGSVEAP